jgi:HD-like signal output (HDOD) protein
MHSPLRVKPRVLPTSDKHPQRAASTHAHERALDKLFARIADQARLPHVAERLLKMANGGLTKAGELQDLIRTDPALTANILRRVNSSYFGLSRKVGDLPTAVSLLGCREIRNIALTVFVSRMYDRPARYGTYNREALWRHCCAAATASRKIARVTNVVPPDEAYVAGLLHHLGTIIIDQHLRSHFCQVIDQLDDLTPTYKVEREVLSFDQAQLAAYVVGRWHFPKQICDAIRYHAHPEDYTGAHPELVNTVAVANYLCNRVGLTSLGVNNTPPPVEAAYAKVGLTRFSLSVVWQELRSTLPDVVR